MNHFIAIALGAGSLLLAGCLRTTESPQAVQTLTPAYTEKYNSVIDSVEYSENGQTLLAAGTYSANLYDALSHQKHVALTTGSYEKYDALIRMAGYIDENTWYFFSATNHIANNIITIRQIEPAHELFKYDLGFGGSHSVLANKHHLASGNTMLNWRDGQKHEVTTQAGSFGYALTANSQVITHNPFSEHVVIDDPIKQERLWIDAGFRVANTAISADAKYVITVSRNKKCTLWQLPEKTRLGNCGPATRLLSNKYTFRPDGRSFWVWGDNEIREYAIPSPKVFRLLRSIPIKMPDQIVRFALNDDWLAVVDEKSNLRVWSLADGSLRGEYANPEMADYRTNAVNLVFQPGGTRLAVSQSSWLMVFDLSTLSAPNDSSVRN